MVDHRALGAAAARARTQVDTLVPHAVLRLHAVVVAHTLGLAVLVRVAEEVGQARADGQTVVVAALGVVAAGRGVARVRRWWRGSCGSTNSHNWLIDHILPFSFESSSESALGAVLTHY